ncbi:MAG: glycosyltransferase [Patescibacteria group bacterium]|nr:glycosyltransferase [Patescibacteria group bacterium]
MTKKFNWPKVSFILLTLNGGEGVRKCLESLKKQSYPAGLVDTVVVDNGSHDDSVSIAKSFKASVFVHPEGTLYSNWVVGLHKTKGEFVFYLEQDIVLRDSSFIKNMIKPLMEDKRLVATFTKEWPHKNMHWVPRFLSYNYCQCDPLLEFLFLPLEKSFIEKHNGYTVCKYEDKKIPPAARMFYRINYLKKTPNWSTKNYFDHDFIINCVRSGYPYFAYVPEPGYYHYHARDLKHLLQKRVRNMGMHYFPEYGKYHYTILNTQDKYEVLRLMLFVIYANLFFPAAIRGFLRFLKYKDWALLMEPVITISVTNALLYAFIKNTTGRKFLTDSISSFFKF